MTRPPTPVESSLVLVASMALTHLLIRLFDRSPRQHGAFWTKGEWYANAA